jgi:predicted ATPase
MIQQFRVQNYKAIFNVTLDLTPLHALIGPNDSGKTSLLEAVAALCRSVDHDLNQAFLGSWEGRELVRDGKSFPVVLGAGCVEASQHFEYDLILDFGPEGRHVNVNAETLRTDDARPLDSLNVERERTLVASRSLKPATVSRKDIPALDLVRTSLGGVEYCRWDPRLLALPVAPHPTRRFRLESSGFGLALLLDDILSYDRDSFGVLEERFRQFFPRVKSIKLQWEAGYRSPPDDTHHVLKLDRATGKGIHFQMANGDHLLPASQASDGMLLVLAYIALLQRPQPPRVILVEEPENGIYPKRLREVLAMLRELVEKDGKTQVLLTTHSPYILDFVKPEEVTLCTRQEDGLVTVHPLAASKTVRELLDVFTLGEIWTSEEDEKLAQSVETEGTPP